MHRSAKLDFSKSLHASIFPDGDSECSVSKEWTYGLVHQGDFREIDRSEVTVGRSRTCDVRIGEPSVSRKHFRLLIGDGAMILQDLGSSNGTYVNDDVVHDRQELTHGDRITMGDIDVFAHIELKADTRPFGLETRMLGQTELANLAAPPEDGETTSESDVNPSEATNVRPPADTWPMDDSPQPDLGAPMATQRFDADALDAMAPAAAPPETQAPEATPPEQPSVDAPSVAGHAGPETANDPHGTRLIQHDFLDVGVTPPQSTPPPPASLTPPPIQFAPAPEMPPIPTPTADPVPAADLDGDLDATDAPQSGLPANEVEKTTPLEQPPLPSTEPPAKGLGDVPLSTPEPPPSAQPSANQPRANGELLGSVAGFDETMVGLPSRGSGTTPSAPPAHPVAVPVPKAPSMRRAGTHVRPQPAGFWLRFLAVLVEGAWTYGLGLGLARLFGTAEDPITRQSAYGVATFVAALAIMIGWSVWGTTPGKRLFRLYVCTNAGQPGIGPLRSLVRAVGYLLGVLTLGIGFLLAGFGTKRALHDRLAGTYVARLG